MLLAASPVAYICACVRTVVRDELTIKSIPPRNSRAIKEMAISISSSVKPP